MESEFPLMLVTIHQAICKYGSPCQQLIDGAIVLTAIVTATKLSWLLPIIVYLALLCEDNPGHSPTSQEMSLQPTVWKLLTLKLREDHIS
jgi:hypothetical protein